MEHQERLRLRQLVYSSSVSLLEVAGQVGEVLRALSAESDNPSLPGVGFEGEAELREAARYVWRAAVDLQEAWRRLREE